MKIETLHKLCGSEIKELFNFKTQLIKAFTALEQASAAQNQPFAYEIVGDLVHITKTGSKTQQKHLAKQTRKIMKKP